MDMEEGTLKAKGRVSPDPGVETKHRQEKEGERERQWQTKTPRTQAMSQIGPHT